MRRGVVIAIAFFIVCTAVYGADTMIVGTTGNSANCEPFGCPNAILDERQLTISRYQQIYTGSAFSRPVWIKAISFFATHQSGHVSQARYNISFSTTSRAVGNLDLANPSNNVGSDSQTFFNSIISVASGYFGTNRQFIIIGTPFLFDPSRGNLLMNIAITEAQQSPWGTIWFDTDGSAGQTSALAKVIYGGAPRTDSGAGLVTGFAVVPDQHESIGFVRNGAWYLDANGDGVFSTAVDFAFNWWGGSGSVPVTGDWGGDGKTKAGFFKDGLWYLDYDGNGIWNASYPLSIDKLYGFGWSAPGVTPITGKWSQFRKTQIGIFYRGFWYLDWNGNGTWDGPSVDRMYQWGWEGTTPVVADWNGDGRDEIGIYKDGLWYLDYDGNGQWDGGTVDKVCGFGWAAPGVTPVVGDWNGDGKKEIGVYYYGHWFLDSYANGTWDVNDSSFVWGWTGVTPVIGDWNIDGRDEVGCFINGLWYLDYNGNGVWEPSFDKLYGWGQAGDTPVVGFWGISGLVY